MAISVGGVSFDLGVNLKSFEKQIDKAFGIAKKKGAGLVWDTSSFVSGLKMTKKEFQAFTREVEKAKDKYTELLDLQRGLQDTGVWSKISEEAKQSFETAVASAKEEAKLYDRTLKHMGRGQKLKSIFGGIGKVFGGIFSVFRQHTAKAGSEFSGFLKKLLGIAGIAALLKKAFNFASQGMQNLVQADSTTANSVAMLRNALLSLKNAFAAAFAPILNTVAPILSKFIGMLVTAANAVASFLSALLGKKFTVQANSAADGLDGIGNSASGANDSAKELQRTLMGFDKINKLDSQSGGGGGGGGAGGGGLSGGGFSLVPVSDEANEWAEKFKESWENADFYWLGELLAEKMNAALAKIPWDKIQEGARKLAKSLATFLNGFIENADWDLVGSTIAQALNTAIYFAQTFVKTFNWAALGKAIADTINGFVRDTDWAALGDTIGTAICGLITTISTFLKGTDWKAIGSAIVETLAAINWSGIFTGALGLIGDIANAIFDLLSGAITAAKSKLKSWIESGKIWEDLFNLGNKLIEVKVNLVKGAWNILTELVGLVAEVAVSLIKSGWKKVKDWINDFGTDGVSRTVSLARNFGSGILTVRGWINSLGTDGVSRAVSLTRDFGKKILTVAGFINSFGTGGVSRAVSLYRAFGKGIATARGFINSFGTAGVSRAVTLFRDFGRGIKTAGAWVKNLGGTVVSVGVSLFKSGWTSLKNFFGLAGGGLVTSHGFKMYGKGGLVPRYGSGGLPDGSQLFWARERGPELVGTMGSHTAVMNNDQIVASVSAGVAKAIAGIRFRMTAPPLAYVQGSGQQETPQVDLTRVTMILGQLLTAVNSLELEFNLDGEQIKNNTVRRINNHTRATGQLEIVI